MIPYLPPSCHFSQKLTQNQEVMSCHCLIRVAGNNSNRYFYNNNNSHTNYYNNYKIIINNNYDDVPLL